jgi:PhzF family phenazine biosynthesis protein
MPIYQVDSFTSEPFRGNPAAVYLWDEAPDDRWRQQLAAEMNLSETAFLQRREDGFQLRWFTPIVEVDLCGHATLAAAHILWSEKYVPHDQEIVFHTLSGLLQARKQGEWIELEFPAEPPREIEAPEGLLDALGCEAQQVAVNRMDLLVEVADAEILLGLQPDFQALAQLNARGVIVTCPSDREGVDFLSRFFAPAVGVDEDPVTGSAHCGLSPYWAAKLGRNELTGYQASARGGLVKTILQGDKVLLGGQAVTVFRGDLC